MDQQTKTPLRLCIECEHKKGIFCTHPDTKEIDLVDGQHREQSCASLRYGRALCGSEGKYWSPKPGNPVVEG